MTKAPVDDAPAGPHALAPGALFAQRFRVRRVLGQGGMGAVYEAVQVALDRRVALKLLHPALAADASLARRFEREAKLLATLRHPHIVEVIDAGVEQGALWIAMEFLEGESLAQWLRDRGGRATPSELWPRVEPVGRALSFMHARGIVHRDVKPENVQLTVDESGRATPKLLDLGIARPPGEDRGAKLTGTGMILGTPAYIAPEQAWGVSDITPAADQWSFAAMLYEAFTGSLPHQADTPMAIVTRRVSVPPERPESLVPGFDPALADVLMRALAQDPVARFPTLDALLDALTPFVAGASAVAPAASPVAAPVAAPVAVDATAVAPEAPVALPVVDDAPAAALDASPPDTPTAPPPTSSWRAALAGVIALALVAAVALRPRARDPIAAPSVTAVTRTQPSAAPAATLDAEPGRVTFVFDFSPSTARIVLDDVELGAGHASVQRPRDGRVHTLRVEGDGVVPYTDVLRATGDVQISRTLVPRDASAPPSHAAPSRGAHAAPPTLRGQRPIDPTWPP